MLTLRLSAFFASFGQTFRKTLPLDYKKGNKHSHHNPHALPMRVKDSLLKVYLLSSLDEKRWRLETNQIVLKAKPKAIR